MNQGTRTTRSGISPLKVFGVGGGGCNVISLLAETPDISSELWAIDSQPLGDVAVNHRLELDSSTLDELGPRGHTWPQHPAAMHRQDALASACSGAALIVIVTGLGGKTGTEVAPVLAKVAQSAGIPVVAIVTLPLSLEGKKRAKHAYAGLAALLDSADIAAVIKSDDLICRVPTRVMRDVHRRVFAVADRLLADTIAWITALPVPEDLGALHQKLKESFEDTALEPEHVVLLPLRRKAGASRLSTTWPEERPSVATTGSHLAMNEAPPSMPDMDLTAGSDHYDGPRMLIHVPHQLFLGIQGLYDFPLPPSPSDESPIDSFEDWSKARLDGEMKIVSELRSKETIRTESHTSKPNYAIIVATAAVSLTLTFFSLPLSTATFALGVILSFLIKIEESSFNYLPAPPHSDAESRTIALERLRSSYEKYRREAVGLREAKVSHFHYLSQRHQEKRAPFAHLSSEAQSIRKAQSVSPLHGLDGQSTAQSKVGRSEKLLQAALEGRGVVVGSAVPDSGLVLIPQYEMLGMGGLSHGSEKRTSDDFYNYVADFALVRKDLGIAFDIEIDEKHHFTDEYIIKDLRRDHFFLSCNWIVIRISEGQLKADADGCAGVIMQVVEAFAEPSRETVAMMSRLRNQEMLVSQFELAYP